MSTKRLICSLLVASTGLLPLQVVRADLIATQVAANPSASTERATILALVKRPDVASQLKALGVAQPLAEQRVAAMTDEEAHMLASNLNSLSAGGQMYGGGGAGGSGASAGVVILVVALVAFLIWWFFGRDSEKTPTT